MMNFPNEICVSHSDNPMADIYGANLYNRYLQSVHHARTQLHARGGSAGHVADDFHYETVDDAKNSGKVMVGGSYEHRLPESCSSILVCTGVYKREQQELSPEQTVTEQRIFHGHRDFRFDPNLTQPSFVVQDVLEAVEVVFQQEGSSLE